MYLLNARKDAHENNIEHTELLYINDLNKYQIITDASIKYNVA